MEDKFEYCEHNNLPTETRLSFLNKMGQLGWELCLVRGGNNYIFKRRIKEQKNDKKCDCPYILDTPHEAGIAGCHLSEQDKIQEETTSMEEKMVDLEELSKDNFYDR